MLLLRLLPRGDVEALGRICPPRCAVPFLPGQVPVPLASFLPSIDKVPGPLLFVTFFLFFS